VPTILVKLTYCFKYKSYDFEFLKIRTSIHTLTLKWHWGQKMSLTFFNPNLQSFTKLRWKNATKGVVGFCKTYPMISNSRNLRKYCDFYVALQIYTCWKSFRNDGEAWLFELALPKICIVKSPKFFSTNFHEVYCCFWLLGSQWYQLHLFCWIFERNGPLIQEFDLLAVCTLSTTWFHKFCNFIKSRC